MIRAMTDKPLPENAHMIPKTAELVFKGTIFDVYHWQQKMFDGSFQTFEMLRRPDTTLVIVIDGNQIIVLDEQQPGTPIQYNSLAGGRVEPGELPLDAAKREIEEEIGMQFNDWALLEVTQPALKIEWFVYVYVAVNKIKQGDTAHEVGEKIAIKRVSFDKFKRAHEVHSDVLRDIHSINELLKKVKLSDNATS
jgi:8-oxo-dGTP pyrophosphatase MutT (NUDIX family)